MAEHAAAHLPNSNLMILISDASLFTHYMATSRFTFNHGEPRGHGDESLAKVAHIYTYKLYADTPKHRKKTFIDRVRTLCFIIYTSNDVGCAINIHFAATS